MNGGTARPLDIHPHLGKVATLKRWQEDKESAAEFVATLRPQFPRMGIVMGRCDRWGFIRHGLRLDCQVVPTGQRAQAKLHAVAAQRFYRLDR